MCIEHKKRFLRELKPVPRGRPKGVGVAHNYWPHKLWSLIAGKGRNEGVVEGFHYYYTQPVFLAVLANKISWCKLIMLCMEQHSIQGIPHTCCFKFLIALRSFPSTALYILTVHKFHASLACTLKNASFFFMRKGGESSFYS